MMHGSSMSTRPDPSDERVFWVFVVVVFLIVLVFLGVGVAYAQPVTATEHITVGSRAAGAEAEKGCRWM